MAILIVSWLEVFQLTGSLVLFRADTRSAPTCNSNPQLVTCILTGKQANRVTG